jgi:hypothetical protein
VTDFVFNIAKGRVGQIYNTVQAGTTPASSLVIVALQNNNIVSDATLKDIDDLGTILAGATDEAVNTGYARKSLTSASGLATFAASVDDTNDWVLLKLPDQTWTGVTSTGTATNAWAKLLVCWDSDTTGGTDSNIVPLTAHDFAVTPDGSDIVAQIATNGFYKAS